MWLPLAGAALEGTGAEPSLHEGELEISNSPVTGPTWDDVQDTGQVTGLGGGGTHTETPT